MTLCIAALCDFGRPNKVVISFDRKLSTFDASAENVFKFDKLTNHWWVLISGLLPIAREIVSEYRVFLHDRENEITVDNATEFLYKPAETYMGKLRDRQAQLHCSMDFAQFLVKQRQFPEHIRRGVFDTGRPDAELILIGYVDSAFHLYKYFHGDVWECDNHAVIGSGTAIAEAALLQRGHEQLWRIHRTIYVVYEAQRLGRIAPGVGNEIVMRLISYDKEQKFMVPGIPLDKSFDVLDAYYQEYGLKPVPEDLRFPQGDVYWLGVD